MEQEESGLPSGGGGLFGTSAIAESMAFMSGAVTPPPETATEPVAEAAAVGGEPAVEAAPAEGEPAAEAAPEAPADDVLPKRGGPSPVLREYLRAQEERVRRAEAAVEAQRSENAKLIETVQQLLAGKAPQAEEPEVEDEPLDPLERDLKTMRAKVEALERQAQERETRLAEARQVRALEAAKREIASEVDSVVKEFPELSEFRNEVYANIAYNAEAARIPGSNVKELPVAEIARQFARRLGLVKQAAGKTAPVAKPASTQVRAPTPASAAPVPRHPAASASVPSVPKDITKLSLQQLTDAWVNGR